MWASDQEKAAAPTDVDYVLGGLADLSVTSIAASLQSVRGQEASGLLDAFGPSQTP